MTLVIQNGRLIDGTGAEPVANATVVIEDGQIKAAGPTDQVNGPWGEDAQVIDAAGMTILPGFIDAHVHSLIEGFDLQRQLNTPFSLRFYQGAQYLRRTLEAGVTTVRDAGGADRGVKLAVEQGLIQGPRMLVSIGVMTMTGGHGDLYMPAGLQLRWFPVYPGSPNTIADGVDEVRKATRRLLRDGADVIKMCTTGGVLSPSDQPEATQFTVEEIRVMVEEAHAHGKRTMSHAQGTQGVKNAVLAGVESIEHGIYLDDEVIEMMLERDTFLVPTLLAPVGILEQAEKTGTMPNWALDKTKRVLEVHKASAARAHQAGVRIAMGTDSGVTPHGENLRELGLMVDIGMSPMEAIVASTKVAAECLALEDRIGTIEKGKLADVVLVQGDPLADIRVLENRENIAVVIKDGKIEVDRR